MSDTTDNDLFRGLQELHAAAFPKVCPTCGRVYNTLADFLEQTRAIAGKSGLKASRDDDDRPVVELFRNCVCGSTLMDLARSRRDETEAGLHRREQFQRMITLLIARGLAPAVARTELLKVMRGEESAVIDDLLRHKGNGQ